MTEEEAIEMITDLINTGDFQKALNELDRMGDEFDDSSEISFLTGTVLSQLNNLSLSHQYYYKAVELSAYSDDVILLNYILSCIDIGDTQTSSELIIKYYNRFSEEMTELLRSRIIKGLQTGYLAKKDVPKELLFLIQDELENLPKEIDEEHYISLLNSIQSLGLDIVPTSESGIMIDLENLKSSIFIDAATIVKHRVETNKNGEIEAIYCYYDENKVISLTSKDVSFSIISNDYVKASENDFSSFSQIVEDIYDFIKYPSDTNSMSLRYMRIMTVLNSAQHFGINIQPLKALISIIARDYSLGDDSSRIPPVIPKK